VSDLVVDASAALSLLRREENHGLVRRHIRETILAGSALLVPQLFWLEIVNVLARRYRYRPDAVVEAVFELEQIGLKTVEVGRPGTLAVVDAVARSGITAYDAAYLVLAESAAASLLTADATLAAAAGARAIMIGPEAGVSETAAPYAAGPSWASWRGAPAYLAELRSHERLRLTGVSSSTPLA
jgi:predicted nucleic acid-binding protein